MQGFRDRLSVRWRTRRSHGILWQFALLLAFSGLSALSGLTGMACLAETGVAGAGGKGATAALDRIEAGRKSAADEPAVEQGAHTQSGTLAQPDTLTLVNGDTVTGKFVRAVGATVTFHTEQLGDLNIGWDKIRSLHSNSSVVMILKGQRLTQTTGLMQTAHGTFSVENKQVTVHPTEGGAYVLPTDKVGYLLEVSVLDRQLHQPSSPWAAWSGTLTAGASIVSATQNSETFTGSVALTRAIPTAAFLPPRSKTLVGFNGAYGRISQPRAPGFPPLPDVKTEIYHANLEQDRYFTSNFFALGQTAFDHNYAQGMALQQIYGGGFGCSVIKEANQQLDLKATIQFERQSFFATSTSPSLDLVGSTFTLDYSRKLAFKSIFKQQLLIIPAYNNLAAASASENDSLAIPLYKRLSVTLSTMDSYLYSPPEATPPTAPNKRNSFQFAMGIMYSLR